MSAANQVRLAYAKEATFGTLAANATSYKTLRYNSETLGTTVNDEDSVEISTERNITSVIPLSATHGGDITTSLSYKNLDAMIESCLYSTFGNINSAGAAVTVSTAGVVAGTTVPNAEVGDWWYISGTGGTGWFRVTKVSSMKATEVTPSPGTAISAGVVNASTASIKNAKTRLGLSIEKFFASLDGTDSGGKDFHYWKGAVVNTMSFEFRAGASIGATVGLTALAHSTASASEFTATLATAEDGIIYSPADVKNIGIGSGATSYAGSKPIITAVTLSVNNNIREGEQLGTLDVPALLEGNFGCEGTVEMYFRDSTMYDRFIGRNEQDLAWCVFDPNTPGEGYGFYMPRVRFRNARVQASGNDADLIAQFDYRALGSTGSSPYTLKISRGA